MVDLRWRRLCDQSRAGNRDHWEGGIAVARRIDPHLLIGIEADRKGGDTIDGRSSASPGLGGIYQLGGSLRLLASAGFHGFLALGVDF